MREIIIQLAVAFIVWSLAMELTAWVLVRWMGPRWWDRVTGEPDEADETIPLRPIPIPVAGDERLDGS